VFFIFLFSFQVRAEYRAYQLLISDSTTGQKRTVITTLDDQQYVGYHHLQQTELIQIQDTWMCRGRSDLSQDINQRICPNMHPKAAQPNG